MFYEFKLSHNATEVTKNISCVKSEDAVDHRTVIDSCKNIVRPGRCKIMDSDAVLQAIEANLVVSHSGNSRHNWVGKLIYWEL